jgi:fatty acid desaturase
MDSSGNAQTIDLGDNVSLDVTEDAKESTVLLGSKPALIDFDKEKDFELRKRNWWIIDGKAYDFSGFVKRHPGGSAAIGLAKGLDCTELFRTYHLMKTPGDSILKKYEVKLEQPYDFGMSNYTFEENGFLQTARGRVRQYFIQEKKSSKASIAWQVGAIFGIFILLGLYYPAYIMGSVIAALVHGFLKGFLAITGGHAMSHFSLFTKGSLNTLVFRFCSPFVLSAHNIWSTSHIVSHHVHTLTHDDLQDNYPVKRIQPSLPFMWFHRFQHVYIWIVYLFGLPLWTFADFFASIPTLFTGKHHMRHLGIAERLENTIGLTINIFITILLPFFFLKFPHALLVCLCSNIPASLMTVIQIAVNHEVPETQNKVDPKNVKIDWGAHQVLTSHNFGVNSKIALHMSGGLNMQVEHHLFPSVHYTHFHAIAPIVQQTCKEFGLTYNTSSSIFEAVKKHYNLLKANSKA